MAALCNLPNEHVTNGFLLSPADASRLTFFLAVPFELSRLIRMRQTHSPCTMQTIPRLAISKLRLRPGSKRKLAAI